MIIRTSLSGKLKYISDIVGLLVDNIYCDQNIFRPMYKFILKKKYSFHQCQIFQVCNPLISVFSLRIQARTYR